MTDYDKNPDVINPFQVMNDRPAAPPRDEHGREVIIGYAIAHNAFWIEPLKTQIVNIYDYVRRHPELCFNHHTNLVVDQHQSTKQTTRFVHRPLLQHIIATAPRGIHIVLATRYCMKSIMDADYARRLFNQIQITFAVADSCWFDTRFNTELANRIVPELHAWVHPKLSAHTRASVAPLGWYWDHSDDQPKLLPHHGERELAKSIADLYDTTNQDIHGVMAHFLLPSYERAFRRHKTIPRFYAAALILAYYTDFPRISIEDLQRNDSIIDSIFAHATPLTRERAAAWLEEMQTKTISPEAEADKYALPHGDGETIEQAITRVKLYRQRVATNKRRKELFEKFKTEKLRTFLETGRLRPRLKSYESAEIKRRVEDVIKEENRQKGIDGC